MSNKDNFIRVGYTTREEWLRVRGKGIGGSDAGVILGLSSWKSPRELFLEKISDQPITEEADDEVKAYGKMAEPAIRTLFAAKFPKLKVKTLQEVLIDKKYPFLRASLDGEIEVLEDFTFETFNGKLIYLKKGMRGVLEIKTKYLPSKDDWKDKVPDLYYAQGVHYMNVTRYDFIIYVVELRYANGSASIRNFLFTKDDVREDIEYLREQEIIFWDKVLKKEEIPEVIKL